MSQQLKTVRFETKTVYGVDQYYPIGENAAIFAELCKTKTLTWRTLVRIEDLGYQLEELHRGQYIPVTAFELIEKETLS